MLLTRGYFSEENWCFGLKDEICIDRPGTCEEIHSPFALLCGGEVRNQLRVVKAVCWLNALQITASGLTTIMPDQSVHPAIKAGGEEVKLQINGRDIIGFKGESIINVAAREGIYIPHYCWHPSLSVSGNCRLCLVEVHLPGRDGKVGPLPKPVIACQTVISPGMLVFTESKLAKECQNGMMEFLLVNHPLDCPICDRGGECMLQRYSVEYGQGHTRMVDEKRKFVKPQFDPLIDIERNRCIMCTRCVRFTDEVGGEHVMGVFDRGNGNYIGTFGRGPVSNILSGNVIDLCPVGCLTNKPFRFRARVWELLQTQSTSIWDGSGAKVTHWTRNGKLYRTTPPSRKYHDRYTVNEDTEEFIDNLTRFASDYSLHENRWDEHKVKSEGTLTPIPFKNAVEAAVEGLGKVYQESGADAIATLVSPRATLEEGYLAGKLTRQGFETENIDWRTNYISTEAAEAVSFALANADGDLENGVDALVVLNGDFLHQAPVLAMRLKEQIRVNEKPLVLIGHHHDNYFVKAATYRLHCQPGETAKVLALLEKAVAGDNGAETELTELCSVSKETVAAVVELLKSEVKKALIVQGLNDLNGALAPAEVPAAIALKKALGAGWGYLPVTRDRNAVGLAAVKAQPQKAGAVTAQSLVADIESGRVKALICVGADVLYNTPHRAELLTALDKLELFVVSDLFESEMTKKADVFFAAASNIERDGTFVDLEGNLARLAEAEEARGSSKADWEILLALGKGLGVEGFDLKSIEAVFAEMMGQIAPEFSGSFKGLMLPGPANDLMISDPGGARKRTKDYNPGDYRVDGAHFRSVGEGAVPGEVAVTLPVVGKGQFLLTFGLHAQGDDYHLNHASIRETLVRAPYVEVNPEDAKALGAGSMLDQYQGRLTVGGESVEVDVLITEGPAKGTLYVPSGLGGVSLRELSVGSLEVTGSLVAEAN